jgi:hypothetical protein
MAEEARADPTGTATRQLLDEHDPHETVAGDAAIVFRKPEAQQPELARPHIKRAREFAGFVPLGREGGDFLVDEAAHRGAERFVLNGIEWTSQRSSVEAVARRSSYPACRCCTCVNMPA